MHLQYYRDLVQSNALTTLYRLSTLQCTYNTIETKYTPMHLQHYRDLVHSNALTIQNRL